MRVLNFSDGFTSNSEPNLGTISVNNLFVFSTDEEFVEYKGLPATQGDIYFNSVGSFVRYFDGVGWQILSNIDDLAGLEVFLQNQINDRATIGSLSSHSSANTGVHGVSGDIVGTTDAQTLTNKTLSEPVINSPSGLSKSDVGLSNVDNTSDASKPISTATQTALNAKADSSTVTAHTGASMGVHGVTGAVVGTTDTQSISNKTITASDLDGGTASNTSRITLPKADKSTLDALTRKEGTVVYATDEDKVYYDDGAVLKPVGSGSGTINFITNPDGSSGTTGWTEGSYTAGTRPTGSFTASSGAGAFTIGRTTTNPLGVTGTSLVFTKSSGNQQGRAVETIFALPLDYRAKVLKLSASYINTSTNATDFAAGSKTTDSDMIFYTAYSTDGGTTYTVAEPSSFKLLSNSKDNSSPYDGTYQTPYNATHLKLIAYVATTSTTAWSIKAVLGVSPSQYVYGSPMSYMGEVTLTPLTDSGSITATAMADVWRIGDRMKVNGKLTFTGATTFSGILLPLPFGASIDANKNNTNDGTFSILGFGGNWIKAGTDAGSNISAYESLTMVRLVFLNKSPMADHTQPRNYTNAAPVTWVAGNTISFEYEVPILGWSSSVQVSDGYDGRVVAARITANYSTTPLTLSGTPQTIKFPTVVRDDVNGYNPATGIYTVPTSGWYRATASAGFNLSGTTVVGQEIARLNLIIGSASFIDQGYAITTTAITGKTPLIASGINYLTAGQGIRVEAGYSGGVSSGNITIYGDGTNLSIEKLSGSPTISASETVACRYTNTAGTTIGTGVTSVPFANKSYDTHGAWDGNQFKAPVAGFYRVSVKGLLTSVKTIFRTFILKNGSIYAESLFELNGGVMMVQNMSVYDEVYLLAGETISIAMQSDLSSGNLQSGTGKVVLTISKM